MPHTVIEGGAEYSLPIAGRMLISPFLSSIEVKYSRDIWKENMSDEEEMIDHDSCTTDEQANQVKTLKEIADKSFIRLTYISGSRRTNSLSKIEPIINRREHKR